MRMVVIDMMRQQRLSDVVSHRTAQGSIKQHSRGSLTHGERQTNARLTPIIDRSRPQWQGEADARALTQLALDPDPPTVPLDQVLGDRQP